MEEHLNELEKLKGKAEKSRQANFSISLRNELKRDLLHYTILLLSSFVALLTFADFKIFLPLLPNIVEVEFKLFVGICASLVFFLTLTEEFMKWGEKSQQHDQTGKLLTSFIRDCDSLLKKDNVTDEEVKHVRARYILINETSPSIPDKVFLKSKREYLLKKEISKRLDKEPHKSIRAIKREIKKGG
ncbi:hypothetical protein SAMN05216353_10710 [Halobacillus alkaliphilus]|uniref:Uncharacterized protein n=1 Tax=Halobacillus alkaliphilus TaxID=396056 RepID=A0A1I2L029_9BACI|nr:hypothetical protein [Halobacillus alkaliphilus]SFF72555.1 hypothetical protein SAMN05216353_10710 [Halobacillus alkaliphilus]